MTYEVLNSGCLTNAEIDKSKRQHIDEAEQLRDLLDHSPSHGIAQCSPLATLHVGLELPDFQVLAHPREKPGHPCFR